MSGVDEYNEDKVNAYSKKKSAIDVKLENLQKKLDDYENSMGLVEVQKPIGIEGYLNLSSQELQEMSAEEVGEAAFILAQYSMYIQKEYNRQNAVKNWAQACQNAIIAKIIDNYGNEYTKFDEKSMKAIYGNDAAIVLQRIIVEASQKTDVLHFLSQKIEMAHKRLSEYQETKRLNHNV